MIKVNTIESYIPLDRVSRSRIRTLSNLKMVNENIGADLSLVNWGVANCTATKQGEEDNTYDMYFLITSDGDIYQTSSSSFFDDLVAYQAIIAEEREAGEEINGVVVRISSHKSKNFAGGEFFRADLIDYID